MDTYRREKWIHGAWVVLNGQTKLLTTAFGCVLSPITFERLQIKGVYYDVVEESSNGGFTNEVGSGNLTS